MSNLISVPRDLAVDLLDGLRITQERARKELRALLAKPAEQGQGEPVAWDIYWTDNGDFYFTLRNKERLFKYADDADLRVVPLYTRPAEQPEPISSTSDKYKAELYDEVWQLARDMGFGNVTDALMKLNKQTAPVAVVLPERIDESICRGHSLTLAIKWNRCLDEVARLNPPQQ